MSIHSSTIEYLPSALGDDLAQRLAGSRPAVFLDYDGTVTPIVDRPQNPVRSAGERRRREMITYHSL
jgi:trehalose 6-phosphate phosphatase